MADSPAQAKAPAPKQAEDKKDEDTRTEGAKVVDKAADAAKGERKKDDQGRVVGVFGGPVSNENPDPRAVRGTYDLGTY